MDYLCETDADKTSVVLQEGETSAYKWVTAEELRSMPRNELATMRMLNFIKDLKWGIGDDEYMMSKEITIIEEKKLIRNKELPEKS